MKAIELLSPEYGQLKMKKGKFKYYDIYNSRITMEVKGELNSIKYGNVAIEHHRAGEPSGIVGTTADKWVHFYYLFPKLKNHPLNGWRMSVCDVSELREWIADNKFRDVWGGNDNVSQMYLIPCYKLHNKFSSILVK